MPFLRFYNGTHEWGFEVDAGYVPAIGDTVMLWHGPPDEESDDSTYAIVTKRVFMFGTDVEQHTDIDYDIELETPLPNNHVADSSAWPSNEHSARQAEIEAIRQQTSRGSTT
ncbi:MAG: hypothetical protein QGF59_27780 [Pirellulaceae bacterium]|jgi:hypothetical protein|nr:hypothetical protein [Pirellulaceae bacterium]